MSSDYSIALTRSDKSDPYFRHTFLPSSFPSLSPIKLTCTCFRWQSGTRHSRGSCRCPIALERDEMREGGREGGRVNGGLKEKRGRMEEGGIWHRTCIHAPVRVGVGALTMALAVHPVLQKERRRRRVRGKVRKSAKPACLHMPVCQSQLCI